ncbi:MAG: hypothetical protein WEB57_07355 [Pseudohongiellaceae bacterium]
MTADSTMSRLPRRLYPDTVLAIAALLLVYYASDGLRLYYTLRALGYRLPLSL